MTRVLLVGGSGRENAIASALRKNPAVQLYTVMSKGSPGTIGLSEEWCEHRETDIPWIVEWAKERRIDWSIIGGEEPLALGIVDELEKVGIPSVGPKKAAARLETSKFFLRRLMAEKGILGQIQYHQFLDTVSLTRFFGSSPATDWVIKPDGLTGGKGVRIMGDHFMTTADAVWYACVVIEEAIGGTPMVILEERLDGPEFTLQCFVDGRTVVPMPVVRDYKRAFEGDEGQFTGGMGSYSQADGLLPGLGIVEYIQALSILEEIVATMRLLEGAEFKGILYGQFMLTDEGVKLIEVNVRFGDPEAINVLPLLQTDFADICTAIIDGTLDKLEVSFDRKATVCKYIAPPGYGYHAPKEGVELVVKASEIEALGAQLYIARAGGIGYMRLAGGHQETGWKLRTTTSRALAILGIAETVSGAESIVEQALQHVEGNYRVRHDIGRI